MVAKKAENVVVLRPKTISRSGEYRAVVHVPQNGSDGAVGNVEPLSNPAAVQGRSRGSNDGLNVRAMSALRKCMTAFGLNNGDMGAILNVTKEHFRRILDGQKPLKIEHQMMMHERMPALLQMYREELFG